MRPTQSRTQCVLGALFPGKELSGSKAGHSPPSSAEIKNEGSYTSTPYTPLWSVQELYLFIIAVMTKSQLYAYRLCINNYT